MFVDLSKPAADVHRQARAWNFAFSRGPQGPILERDGGRVRLVRTSLTEVEGAERIECADAPLWIVESSPRNRTPGPAVPLASDNVETSHDVLVVGAGCAGMRAAIEAHDAGADVGVISKLHPTRSHSGAAEGGINAALGNAGEDSRESTPSTRSRAPTTSATRTRSRSSAGRRPATSTSSSTGARSSRGARTASSPSARSAPPARPARCSPPTSPATCSSRCSTSSS